METRHAGETSRRRSPGSLDGRLETVWMFAGAVVFLLATVETPVLEFPLLLFWLVFIAASLCVVAAIATHYVASTENLAELGLMSSFTFALSVLPLVHGLTTPGVIFGPNSATMSSVLWAGPIASVAVFPLALPKSKLTRLILRRWRLFSRMHMTFVATGSLVLIARTTVLPAYPMRSSGAVFLGGISVVVCILLSIRHLRFARIAGSNGPFAVSCGFVLVGASNAVWLASAPFTPVFWFAHLVDIAGVFTLTLIAMRTYHQDRTIRLLLGPLVAQTPLAAFELGLEPLVHRFVSSLERKDTVTREHVARTAELAIGVGGDIGLPADQLHILGLGALLHDIGKLNIDDRILKKTSNLTADEFTAMKVHTDYGDALVSGSSTLRSISPIVRGHHERIDGRGYPDQLSGDNIPLLARIVSVCDAYDAMANTRRYRKGMDHDKVVAILREHSGSQWDARIVEALIKRVTSDCLASFALQNVGRDPSVLPLDVSDELCGCIDQTLDQELAARTTGQMRSALRSASGLSTQGFVEILPVSGTVAEGDRVVIGTKGGVSALGNSPATGDFGSAPTSAVQATTAVTTNAP